MQRLRKATVFTLALLIGSFVSAGVAGALHQATPGPRLDVRNLKVVDDQGSPFPRAGIMAWPVGGGAMVAAGADADGTVELAGLDPTVEYEVTAFAINTRWCGGWTHPTTGDVFHFSEPVQAYGAQLARPTTFVVESNCTRVTVLDGGGRPFAEAGAMAWPVGGGGMIAAGADADGNVELIGLDPDVEYEVTAFAIDTGWTCGYSVNPNTGAHRWFSTPITGTPATIDATTLIVTEPNCP